MAEATRLIGFDAGATKTVVVGRARDQTVRRAGGGTNLRRDGLDATAARLSEWIGEVLRELPAAERVYVCGGVAGAGREDERAALETVLEARLVAAGASASVTLLHDGALALESALPDGASGLVCVVGTGSILLARTRAGAVLRTGGWGPEIDGDPGSGMAIGRAALAAAAAAFDGGPETALSRRLRERLGIDAPDGLIRVVYSPGFDASVLAPEVIDAAAASDRVAREILRQQAAALALRAKWLARKAAAQAGVERAAVLAGGLGQVPAYAAMLHEALVRQLKGWALSQASRAPEEAALALAAAHAAS